MLSRKILTLAASIGSTLIDRGETVAVAESSCGGLVSAALLSVPGASSYYVGGAVVYTGVGREVFLADAVQRPAGLRGATEEFARYCAHSIRARVGSTWGLGEGGATGPAANPYGDPPGHTWLAVSGPVEATRHLLTGQSDRLANMCTFTEVLLTLLSDSLKYGESTISLR